jgi:hypothetical protein
MKIGKLLTLLIVTIVVCVAAVVLYHRQNAETASESWRGKKLLSALGANAEKIRRIEFAKGSDKMVLVKGTESDWRAETTDGYPADVNRITQLVFNLTELTAADRITDDKTKYEKLGVGKDVGENGTLVLSDDKGATLVRLVLGKSRQMEFDPEAPPAPSGYFLRVNADPYVYLTNQSDLFYMEPKVARWANTEILNVSGDDLTSLRIDTKTSGTSELVWNDGALQLKGVPSAMQQKDSSVRETRNALSGLRFDNVMSAKRKDAAAMDFSSTWTATAKSGVTYTIRGGQAGDKKYIAMSASYAEPFYTDDDKASTATMAAVRKKAGDAKQSVPEFNRKHGAWVYEIAAWTFQRMFKGPGELIEPRATPTPTPTPVVVVSNPTPAPAKAKKATGKATPSAKGGSKRTKQER